MNVVVIKGYCFIHSSILDPSLSLQIGKIWHFRCSALAILRSCYIHSRTRDPPLSLARIFCPDGNAPVAAGHKRSNTDGRFQSTQNFNRTPIEVGWRGEEMKFLGQNNLSEQRPKQYNAPLNNGPASTDGLSQYISL